MVLRWRLSIPCLRMSSSVPRTFFYVDGSCLPGKYGGWAWALVRDDKIIAEQSGAQMDTTNQYMELSAAHHALSYMWDHRDDITHPVCFVSDSKYVINGIQTWSQTWIHNGFRTSRGKPVEHTELWKSVLYHNHPSIQWTWLKGHSGHFIHDHVDQLAHSQATRLKHEAEFKSKHEKSMHEKSMHEKSKTEPV